MKLLHGRSTLSAFASFSLAVFALLCLMLLLSQAGSQPAQAVAAPAEDLSAAPAATDDLSLYMFSQAEYFDAIVGDVISITVWYQWGSDSPVANVKLVNTLPEPLQFISSTLPVSSRSGQVLQWNLGTLDDYASGSLDIWAKVPEDAPTDTIVTNTATISGDVVESDLANNTDAAEITIQPRTTDLWVFLWGLLEEAENGNYSQAEVGVETAFELNYFNWSTVPAEQVVLTNVLPEGLQFVSAVPAPASVNGQTLTWNLGTLDYYEFGTITVRAVPTKTGSFSNEASLSTSTADLDVDNNTSSFNFEVVPLLQPRLLKPNMGGYSATSLEEPLIVGSQTRLEGLARSGATVTLYQGPEDCGWQSFEDCGMTPIASTTAGADRRWTLNPTFPVSETLALYLRAELGSDASSPPFGFWEPFFMRVDPAFDQAGFDFDNFTVNTGGQEVRPGALGGQSSTTPNEGFSLRLRQEAPDSIGSSPALLANHDLKLVIEDGGETYTETLPVQNVQKVPGIQKAASQSPAQPDGYWDVWDFIYVHKGFGPGAKVEIWCLPVFYTDEGLPIVGLVYVKCHEILIDPAGYVYDVAKAGATYEWPAVPPMDALITNATVTMNKRSGNNTWERWAAEDTGQVNPQITDSSRADRIPIPGYFAFYVPSGQYQVLATAPNCSPYTSPVLTVVDAPVFHNVGMNCNKQSQTGGYFKLFVPLTSR